jgi:hypothetical protein
MARMTIERFVSPVLRDKGYLKSGQTWRKRLEAAVLVVNLQRSNDVVFVNLGACIRDLTNNDSPSIRECQISFRLERVCPPTSFEAIRSASPDGGPQELVVALADHGLPWLEGVSTRQGVRKFLQSSLASRGWP